MPKKTYHKIMLIAQIIPVYAGFRQSREKAPACRQAGITQIKTLGW